MSSGSRVISRAGFACVLLLGSGTTACQQPSEQSAVQSSAPVPVSARWVTAWGTSQQSLGETVMTNATVRMIAQVTSSGESVRVRFDNTYGERPLRIGRAYVGSRMRGATLSPGSNRELSFGGAASITVPPGGSVRSDPVEMRVLAFQDLAVSLHVPDADVRPSQHTQARVTSHVSADDAGDVAADETGTPFTGTTVSMFWLKSIDVLSSSTNGAIVAFGDSITDGSCSTLDGHDRWEDWLAVRLNLDARRERGGAYTAIVNEGIGGNTVTAEPLRPPPVSTPGVERLERDVLSHSGVTHVILFMGTNDIRREASASQVIAGMEEIIMRVRAAGLQIIGVTIIPRHDRAPAGDNTGWNQAKTQARNTVNAWMRTDPPFDAVLDFDQVARDLDNPDLIFPAFDCDGIHPTARGYYEMATSVPLDLFVQ